MKKLLFIFLFLCSIGAKAQNYTITIDTVYVGNVGQYRANALTVQEPRIGLTATSFTVDVYLIYIDANGNTFAIPDEWGHYTVTLSFPLSATRNSLFTTWRTAILTAPNPDFILR